MKLVLPVALTWAAFAFYFGPALDQELASAEPPIAKQTSAATSTYQGKGVRWWARRAVQARKDANARARTIRRLQRLARGQLAYPTGHWLDGAFLCIHRYEGSWRANTGNGYRGGLQMDSSFARTYGPAWAWRTFGGPERWPASVQITAAIQAWTTRGFGPWPTTRRMCGL